MLQQESSGQAVAFEEKLGDLNTEWQTVIQVWDCPLSPNSIFFFMQHGFLELCKFLFQLFLKEMWLHEVLLC